MGVTFISNSGGAVKAGTIVLWYGTKAAIPDGWTYYSAAAGKFVLGATSASTSALGSADHTHTYSAKTGVEGSHNHSTAGVTFGAPINMTTPQYFAGATKNAEWADNYHTNHSKSIAVSTAPNHDHSMVTTGSASQTPSSFGLYYIKKA